MKTTRRQFDWALTAPYLDVERRRKPSGTHETVLEVDVGNGLRREVRPDDEPVIELEEQ